MLKKYLSQIENKVAEIFSEDSSGHDVSHLKRVMNIALKLQEKEGGNRVIIGLSAYLHDIHRIMQNQIGKYVSPAASIPKVKEILSVTNLTKIEIDEICYCIEHHENYNWNGNNVTNLNALIVQDADNLDALGAIGIGRTFNYGGAHNAKMYDESVPINNSDDYTEFNGDDESTIHHFYHKLFKLGDNMNTMSAKQIAKNRTDYMKNFVSEFLDEWNGIK